MQTDSLCEHPLLCISSCVCQDVYNSIHLSLCHLSMLYLRTIRQVYLNAVYSLDFGMFQRLSI
jgi:hypothetical protein